VAPPDAIVSVPVSRYDLLLVAIALPVAAAALLGAVSSLEMATALAFGGVPASGGVGYAILAAPPTDGA